MQSSTCCYLILLCAIGVCFGQMNSTEWLRKTLNEYGSNELDSNEYVKNATSKIDEFCPEGSEKLKVVFKNATNCFIDMDEQQGNDTNCAFAERLIDTCITPSATYLEGACFKGPSKTLPKFFLEALKSVTKYICSISAESLLELSNFCFIEDTKYSDEVFEKVMINVNRYDEQNELPSKDDMCSDLTEYRPNVVQHIESTCFNPITKRALTGFYDAVLRPCGNSPNAISGS